MANACNLYLECKFFPETLSLSLMHCSNMFGIDCLDQVIGGVNFVKRGVDATIPFFFFSFFGIYDMPLCMLRLTEGRVEEDMERRYPFDLFVSKIRIGFRFR